MAFFGSSFSLLYLERKSKGKHMKAYEHPSFGKISLLYLTYILLLLGLVFFSSCQDMFQYSQHEVTIDEELKGLNAKSIEKISKIQKADTLKFVLIGDTQRFYDDAADFVKQINKRNDLSFVMLAGDISDFGMSKEFKWVHRILSGLYIPYVAVIGNHDMLSNGTRVYETMYGPLNFSFTCAGNKFLCINTNSREYYFNGKVPDLSWIEQELADTAAFVNAFTVAHMPPFSGDFDKRLEKPFTEVLANSGKVRISMYGHEHKYSLSEPYGDRVKYLVVGSMNKRNYAIVTIIGEKYEIETIYF